MKDCRRFILCRDRSETRRVRRIIAECGCGFNVQVGTWLELVAAALDAYLLIQPQALWKQVLAQSIGTLPDCFWANSYAIAPGETTTVVAHELELLLRSLPPDNPYLAEHLSPLSGRVRQQVDHLALLHDAMGGAFPADLAATLQILKTPLEQALRCVAVYTVSGFLPSSPWVTALIDKLNGDSAASVSPRMTAALQQCIMVLRSASDSALNGLQRDLYLDSTEKIVVDTSVQWLAARDYLEEIEVVAGMIQQQMQPVEGKACCDIAILLPSDRIYSVAVQEVFQRAGLPLSGLSVSHESRDLVNEVVFHLLQTLRKPAPTMAMAAFVTSPLLPWTKTHGFEIAAALMGGDYSLKSFRSTGSASEKLYEIIRTGVDDVAALQQILKEFPPLLNKDSHGEQCRQVQVACESLAQFLDGVPAIPWDMLLTKVAPHPQIVADAVDFNQEGIAVFYENEEPWRQVDTLYVLGFNANHYPHDARNSQVFSDNDLAVLCANGFQVERCADTSERLRHVFRRQLAAAQESIQFLLSRRDSYGKTLTPSSSLCFMAQIFGSGAQPESLIIDLDTAAGKQAAVGVPCAKDYRPVAMRELGVNDLALEHNLLEILKNNDGSVRAQSPSSLETLMTSPFAWLLNRARLEPANWAPDSLDVMAKGTLAHAVFELLFAPGCLLPNEDEIVELVPKLFQQVMQKIKPFLNRPEWKVERYNLQNEILIAAQRWREVLDILDAQVLGVEVWLNGVFGEQAIHGSADLLMQLPDGKIYVVDYKKSSSKKRKERMKKGYDSQASLYRIMLQSGEATFTSSEGSKVSVEKDQEIGALYYLMNDQVALADSDSWVTNNLRDFEELGANVSINALPLIRQRLEQVKLGKIMLNKDNDETWYEKNAGIPLYALNNSPLIRMFMHPSTEGEE